MADDIVTLGIAVDSRDVRKADKDLDSLAKTSKTVEGNVTKMASAFSNTLKGAVAGVSFGYLAKDILDTNRQMEMLRASLTSVTGSIESGKDAFKFVQQFAVDTPFEVEDLTKAFISLKNFGIQPTAQVMQAISDQASKLGGSTETLNSIVLQLGQAYAKGKLQQEDMVILAERGVPVYDLLSKTLGKTVAEIQQMGSKGQLTRDVIQRLIEVMGKEATGSSVRAMETLSGSISNLSDAWKNFEDTLMQDKSEGLIKSIVNNVAGTINSVSALIDGNLSGQINRLETMIQYYQRGNLLIKGAMTAGGFDESSATSDLERLRRAQEVEKLRTIERQQNEARTAEAKRQADARMAKDAEETAAREKNAKKQIAANKKIAESWKDFDQEMTLYMMDSTSSLVADVEEYNKKLAENTQKTTDELADAWAKYNDRVAEEEKKKSEEMSKYAERAAQNIQDSFANFLFDPFAKGTENMGLQFANLLRRMVAEMAASSIMDTFKPLLKSGASSLWGGITGMFGSGFTPETVTAQTVSAMDFSPIRTPMLATGGDFAGGYRIVGENGAELEATGASRIFNAQQTKDILSGGNSGSTQIVVNVTNDKNMSADQLGAKIAEQIATKVSQREIANASRIGNQLNPTTRFK